MNDVDFIVNPNELRIKSRELAILGEWSLSLPSLIVISETSAIRVAVFDDSENRRMSLRYLIEMHEDLVCAGIFEDATSAVERTAECKPDVVLMDIEMPGITGIEAARLIKTAFPEVVILMQTVFDGEDMIFDAIKAGASGYLIKKSPPEKIVEGIREAAAGGAPMSPGIAAKVLGFFRRGTADTDTSPAEETNKDEAPEKNPYSLTAREKQVLHALVEGMSYKMVAAELNVSYNTVNTHVRHIYEKLHVHSVGEVVAKALRERLV